VVLWIGNNNLDWVASVGPGPHEDIEAMCQKMAADFRKEYARQLDRLVERARDQEQRRAIIVFGLFDLARYFEARDAIEQLRQADPKLYPSFEIDYQRFESMKPEYRATMVRLAVMFNAELQAMVDEFNRTLGGDSKVRLEYSDALTILDDPGVEWLHPMDAWHLSPHGHTRVAEAAFDALRPSLDFLGIVPLKRNTDSRQEP
jgi:lysophospholipase L1-like esterase